MIRFTCNNFSTVLEAMVLEEECILYPNGVMIKWWIEGVN